MFHQSSVIHWVFAGDSVFVAVDVRSSFLVIGWPQHLMVPSPPLVTTNSELHFAQEYLLPVSFAKFRYLLTPYLTMIIARAQPTVNEPASYRAAHLEAASPGVPPSLVRIHGIDDRSIPTQRKLAPRHAGCRDSPAGRNHDAVPARR